MAENEITLREATIRDLQSVLDINQNLFFGLDYLPSYYPWIVHSTRHIPYVVCVNDKIIGFAFSRTLDNGKIHVGLAGRTNPQFQGKGFYQLIGGALAQHISARYPHTEALLFNRSGTAKPAANTSQIEQLECSWNIHFSVIQSKTLHKGLESLKMFNINDMHQVSLSQSNSFLSEFRTIIAKTGQYFTYGPLWDICKTSEDNIRYVTHMADVTATFSGNGENRKPISVSFAGACLCELGIHASFNYYGESTEDCLKHIVHFLAWCARVAPPGARVGALFHLPIVVDYKHVKGFMTSYFDDNTVTTGKDLFELGGTTVSISTTSKL